MKRHFRVLVAALLLTAVVMISAAVPTLAQEVDPAPIAVDGSPACKAIFIEATGELVYRSHWGKPYRGQATAEYLLSFPPLTIGFLKAVAPAQNYDYGVQTFTATPVSMRFSLKDAQNQTLLRLPCTLVIH